MENIKKWGDFLKINISTVLVVLFLTVFSLLHIKLISNTFYIDSNNNFHSTTEGYGDIPLHLTQISKFAFSETFDTSEPIFFGERMNYHFFFNFIRGSILSLTGSWDVAVIWPLVLLVTLNVFFVFIIYNQILKNKFLAISSLLLFYLGPNLAWINAILEKKDFFLTRADAVYPLQNVAFGAPLFLCFTHQHTAILGLSLFLIFIYGILRLQKDNAWWLWALSIISLGFLPLSHVHSFIAGVILLAVVVAVSVIEKNYKYVKKVLIVGFTSLIITIPQLLYLLSGNVSGGNFMKFRLGWMVGDGIGSIRYAGTNRTVLSWQFLDFIWINFGIILPIFFIGLVLILIYLRRANIDERKNINKLTIFGLGGILLFMLVELVQFQPWDNDNNKILVYFLFFSVPVVIWFLNRLELKWFGGRNFLIIPVILISILTGILYSGGRLAVRKQDLPTIFPDSAMRVAEYVRTNVRNDRLVLTGPTHLNPVSSLAGRQVLVGYLGWLWTRGIDYESRLKMVEDFYRNPRSDAEIFSHYPISHILYDNSLEYSYGTKEKDLDSIFERVFESDDYVVYSVNKTKK